MSVVPDERFADAVVAFVQAFGLHRPERTPCGFEGGVADAHALAELSDGSLRQSELVERLGLAKSTVSRLIDNLEGRGFVQRLDVPGDARGVTVELSRSGRAAAERLARARAERMRTLLDAVPVDRRVDVVAALEILEEAARATDPRHA
jgi:DNA-binding MarR family transcriptional regulator